MIWMTSVALATRRRSRRSTTRPVKRRPITAAAVVVLTARAAAPAPSIGVTSETSGGQRPREAEHVDERDEGGRDDHAADGRPVERDADGEPPAPHEPGRDDDVDRRAAHRSPAERHHEEDRVELPGLRDDAEGA